MQKIKMFRHRAFSIRNDPVTVVDPYTVRGGNLPYTMSRYARNTVVDKVVGDMVGLRAVKAKYVVGSKGVRGLGNKNEYVEQIVKEAPSSPGGGRQAPEPSAPYLDSEPPEYEEAPYLDSEPPEYEEGWGVELEEKSNGSRPSAGDIFERVKKASEVGEDEGVDIDSPTSPIEDLVYGGLREIGRQGANQVYEMVVDAGSGNEGVVSALFGEDGVAVMRRLGELREDARRAVFDNAIQPAIGMAREYIQNEGWDQAPPRGFNLRALALRLVLMFAINNILATIGGGGGGAGGLQGGLQGALQGLPGAFPSSTLPDMPTATEGGVPGGVDIIGNAAGAASALGGGVQGYFMRRGGRRRRG